MLNLYSVWCGVEPLEQRCLFSASLFERRQHRTPKATPAQATATSAAAVQTTLIPVRGNTLYENPTGVLSNGAGEFFFVGRTGRGRDALRCRLLAFDVAGNVPAGSTIVSASLTLHMSKTIAGSQTVELNRVTSDWGEGNSNSTQAGGGRGTQARWRPA